MKKIAFALMLLSALPAVAGMTEGLGYFDNQQYAQAFAEFKPLADKNDERAQYYVAYMYLNGYGTTQDEERGLTYLQKSSDQGFEKAMAMMGYFLSEGLHLPQDKEKAFELYTKAAEKGDDDALLNLGVLYYLGDGVEQSTRTALEYFQKVNLYHWQGYKDESQEEFIKAFDISGNMLHTRFGKFGMEFDIEFSEKYVTTSLRKVVVKI